MRIIILCLFVIFSTINALKFTFRPVAVNLNMPLYITHSPNDSSRIFVIEQQGKIKIIYMSSDTPFILPTPFLDITSEVNSLYSEQGLLGLAFHPNYTQNKLFYVYYNTYNGNGDTVLAEYKVSNSPNIADPSTKRILLTVPQPQFNHNGGWIGFGPDNYLYCSIGDGGGSNDMHGIYGNSQNLTTLLGKMLKIDVGDHIPADKKYQIPSDNPFGNEIWAYGLRNAWRNSFDFETGNLYIADVGQYLWEEINIEHFNNLGGKNYGWRCMEGKSCTGLAGCVCNDPSLTLPKYVYPHSVGCSVTGGYVYRGNKISELKGYYIYGDFCSMRIWKFLYNGADILDHSELILDVTKFPPNTVQYISSFGIDNDGEIYISDYYTGKILKLVCMLIGDFNDDCNVNINDLASLLINWGPCDNCVYDIDGDGIVNINDLSVLLVNWS